MKLKFIKVYQAINLPSGGKLALTAGLDGVATLEIQGQVVVVTLTTQQTYFIPLANIPYGVADTTTTIPAATKKQKDESAKDKK